MKYRKEDILRVTFYEFLHKGYESPIIPCLQKQLGMSRGAVYRHYRDKNDLFKSVIDYYFFDRIKRILSVSDPRIKISQFIDMLYRKILLLLVLCEKAGVTQKTYLSYTGLLNQAIDFYPGFEEATRNIKETFAIYFKRAFLNSIEAKEIKSGINIDLFSKLFTDIYLKDNKDYETGTGFFNNMKNGLTEKTRLLNYLFSLIKA